MCALTTPMFSSNQQEWYYASKMKYPLLSQVDSLSPTLQDLPSFLYPLDDSTSSNINLDHHHHPQHHPHMSLSQSIGGNSNSKNVQEVEKEEDQTTLEKRLSHNARERDRRKKINSLYVSLGALLPPFGQKKKLSIARTVSKVLKYIPEQRLELQRLSKRKKELLKRKTMTLDHHHHHQEKITNKSMMDYMSQQISANWLSDTEISLQITTSKYISISDMLLWLEEKGLNVINVSSSVSSTSRIFYTMHLEKRGDCILRLEELNGMLHQLY